MSHRLTITLPDKIYKQLKKRAEENLRSLSNQIIYELTTAPTSPAPTSTPASTPVPSPTPAITSVTTPVTTPATSQPLSSKEELQIRAELVRQESPLPPRPQHYVRADGEPFEIEDFERYLPESAHNSDTYATLRKKVPSSSFIAMLREGSYRSMDDFIKLLKEDYIVTIYSALDIPMNHNLSKSDWRELAGYLMPCIPDEHI